MIKRLFAELYNKFHYSIRALSKREKKHKKETEYVELPKDDGFVSGEDIQWWYWTGHLKDKSGNKYGFEVVFFAFNSWGFFKNILAQAAITDISRKEYHFREIVEFLKLPKKLDSKFQLMADEKNKNDIISAVGGGGEDDLRFVVDGYDVSLNLKQEKGDVVHYNGKKHKYCFGGDTYYYARESMKTKGKIIKDGKEISVDGVSWFDRQYGELYQAIFKGWQWFAIKLGEDISIMIYHFREEYAKERFASITRGGKTVTTGPDGYTLNELKTWTSPHTGIVYPAAWKISLENYKFLIIPAVADQELRAKHHIWIGPEYWEGACRVYNIESREEIGDAYVELNGYGTNKIITIDLIDEEELWKH